MRHMIMAIAMPFRLIWDKRGVVVATSIHDLRQRYQASTFGLLWTFLFPLIFLGLYSLVFTLILQVRVPEKSSFEYTLIIFSGLIPFLGFTEALSSGVGSLIENRSFLKGAIFPVELIAVKTVIVSSVTMVVGLCILILILGVRGELHLSIVALPFAIAIQWLFSIGLVWALSILNVFFRDLGNLVSPLILFLMLVSPIGYTKDMVPDSMMPILAVNPLYYMISIYRDVIHHGVIPWEYGFLFGSFSLLLFVAGFHLISRLKTLAADYV